MVMGYIWTLMGLISLLCAGLTGQGAALAAAIPNGAQEGVRLAIALGGSLCLWAGVGALMEKIGITAALSRLLKPVLGRIFPSARKDPALAGSISGNLCANFLGLGNAATPLGIRAAKSLANHADQDGLCRLVVLNTASIQLIPTTVAALRAQLGSAAPFDILLPVWITSLCSAGVGLLAAILLGKVWK